MYYKAPLQLNEKIGLLHVTKSIRESIDAFLELIIFTPKGGFKADYDFGFEFWSNEFQNLMVEDFNQHINETELVNRKGDYTNRKNCLRELKKTIEFYEPRLDSVKIDLNLRQKNQIKNNLENKDEDQTKYDVVIVIRGEIHTINNTKENYLKQIVFTVGPAIKK